MAGWTLSLARFPPVAPPLLRLCCLLSLLLFPAGATGQAGPPESARPAQNSPHLVTIGQPGEGPVNLTADRVSYNQDTGVYDAQGSVVIVQGPLRLTADQVIYRTLTGVLIATGRVHLSDPGSDLWSERLEMNVNTEVGVVVNGELFLKDSTTTVTGRLLQRFSEDHYRGKDGSFTNCDTREGRTPAWRFRFEDLDMDLGDRLYAKNLWFCVNDVPVIPVPRLVYPLGAARKTGFLIPSAGIDNRFGFVYRQGFFWALSPSLDLTITPQILSKRGYGGDLEYRYILDRRSRGQWLVSFIQDTTVDRSRAVLTGSHAQFVTPTLSIRAQGNYLTDRTILENLSNSGVLRALPSQESYLSVNQQHDSGNLYLFGQYLQPLGAGGRDTFQRLPELGHSMVGVAPFDGPVLVGLDSTFVNFFREEGFGFNRADVVPGVSTEVLDLGHVIGLMPQFKFRETYYTRGVATMQSVHRETFWAGVQATSRMARRFRFDEGGSLLHTIEPQVFYEYVPPSDQSDIIVVDAIDDLPKKHLVTYSTRTRLLGQHAEGRTTNWLDLTVAQSYRLGAAQSLARAFPFPGDPQFSTLTQPLQPVRVPIEGKKFSDVWLRAVLGNPVGTGPKQNALSLTVDAFLDPYQVEFSQINTDLRYQQGTDWYLEVGQRYTHSGNRVRRGDIWNPLSFGEVFAPTPELEFVTAAGAVRLPFSWTVGARTYYDIDRGKSPETDVVALYQNPCRCWSLGLFYIKFPDREQYNFLISLTGVGATESLGVQVLRAILSPLLEGERGLPWAPGRSRQTSPSPTVGTAQ